MTPYKHATPYRYYCANFGHSGSNDTIGITEICQNNLTPCVPLFKVTETYTNWLATYDFLLLIHTNHGPTSYRTIWNIKSNIA